MKKWKLCDIFKPPLSIAAVFFHNFFQKQNYWIFFLITFNGSNFLIKFSYSREFT